MYVYVMLCVDLWPGLYVVRSVTGQTIKIDTTEPCETYVTSITWAYLHKIYYLLRKQNNTYVTELLTL